MYKFIKIMSWELYGDEKKCNYMLEIDILRNSSQKKLGVQRGPFLGFMCPKDALLAKTVPWKLFITRKCLP